MAGALYPARLPRESVVSGSPLLQSLKAWQLVLGATSWLCSSLQVSAKATLGAAWPPQGHSLSPGRWVLWAELLPLPFLLRSRHRVPRPGCAHTSPQPLPGIPDQVREGAVVNGKVASSRGWQGGHNRVVTLFSNTQRYQERSPRPRQKHGVAGGE